MNRKLLLFSLIFFLFSESFADKRKLNIAVNELTAKGVENSAAGIISDRLRSELIATGSFRVMERNEMTNVLKEQGFQQSGSCKDAACLVEVGQLLGVERMVSGSIGKINKLYTLSLRIIHVGTGEITHTVNVDYEGSIKGVLAKAVKKAAAKLDLGVDSEIEISEFAGEKGDLYISTKPESASVVVNGKEIKGKTPLLCENLPAGKKIIEVKKGYYYGSKKTILKPDDLLKLNIKLKHSTGALKIFTKPNGAEIFLDGNKRGVSPCKIDDIPAGKHILEMKKDQYFYKKRKFSIKLNETRKLTIELKPASILKISSKPSSAELFINGQKEGKTPYENKMMEPGKHKIKLTKHYYKTLIDSIYTSPEEVKNKTYVLERSDVYRDSIKALSKEKSRIRQWVRRISFGSGALLTGALGIYYDKEAEEALDKYRSAETTNVSVHNRNWADYEDNLTYRNVMCTISCLFLAGMTISIPF